MSRAEHILEELVSQELTNEVVNMLMNHGSDAAKKLALAVKKLGKAAYRDDLVGDAARHIKNKLVAAYNRGEKLDSAGAKRAFVKQHVDKAMNKFNREIEGHRRRGWAGIGLATATAGLYGKYSGKYDPFEKRDKAPKGVDPNMYYGGYY